MILNLQVRLGKTSWQHCVFLFTNMKGLPFSFLILFIEEFCRCFVKSVPYASFSTGSLLVYREATEFRVLTLYPVAFSTMAYQ